MRLAVVVATLGLVCAAHAQDESEPEGEPAAGEAALTCAEKWGCWDVIHMRKGAILGVRTTLTSVTGHGENALDSSFVSFYSMEHFATHEHLAVHFATFGSAGGGTAGSELGIGVALDFGWRAPVTQTSGPFLRAGFYGVGLRHDALRLGIFQPLQLRAGYQSLDGDRLIEAGITQGFVALGTFRPGPDASRSLARASEVGGYAVAHVGTYRADVSLGHLFAPEDAAQGDLNRLRGSLCSYQFMATLCADAHYTRGEARGPDGRDGMRHVLYMGLSVGMSP